ncbi:MAG: hypothetical protein KY464_13805 [Gemmatimonadetes bacterium]|nr:hypothetical protein [Gemmatimonadota bacterium]
MKLRSTLLIAMLVSPLLAAPAGAQRAPAPLDGFIKEVAYLWSGGDARGLAELVPEDARVLLDTGGGMETVEGRHAAAALRALFSERQSLSVRPARITVAGTRPPRGFGVLSWAFRSRGGPAAQSGSVYVGAVWTEDGWRISELRLMQ